MEGLRLVTFALLCILVSMEMVTEEKANSSRQCQKPKAPKHGHVTYKANENGTAEATFSCDLGFKLIGAETLKCNESKHWTGGSFPTCRRKRKFGCVLPEEPLYGYFNFNPKLREIIYHCDEGFELYGMRYDFRTCQRRTRKWTGEHGTCIMNYYASRQCQKPEAPKHGHVTYKVTKDGSGEATFSCDLGFKLNGAKTLKCKDSKHWTGGSFPVCRSQQTVEDFVNILKEDFIDPLAASTVDSKASDVHGKLSVGKSGLDLILMLDVSASIGPKSLQTSKDFMKLIVEQFGVSERPDGGKNGTRVAFITFSSKAEVIFNVNDKNIRSPEKVKEAIDKVKNAGGGTNLKDALEKAADIAILDLEAEEKRFKDSTRAVFILTDAEATFTDTAEAEKMFIDAHISTLKEFGFEIFAIGVGTNIDRDTLEDIATEPTDEHVFLTKDFKDLDRVRDIIAEINVDYGQCGISGNFEVQNGFTESKEGAWPWLGWLGVMMLKDSPPGAPDVSFTCGGALLCDRWFLTVAHCVSFVDQNGSLHTADTKTINLNLGDHDIYEPKDNNHIIAGVKEIFLHPDYTGEVTKHGIRKYDIALLDLGEEIPPALNKFIRPICFPTEKNKGNDSDVYGVSAAMLASLLKSNRPGYTAGWGHAPINANLAKLPWGVLSQGRRRLQPHDRCLKLFPGLDTDLFFCVFNSFGENDFCRGDIGGPFMDEMTNDRFTVLGLAAKTHDCSEPNGFSIFLDVINPTISDWVGEKLDGCNRVKEDPGWSERMQEKRKALKEKLAAEDDDDEDEDEDVDDDDDDSDDDDSNAVDKQEKKPKGGNKVKGKPSGRGKNQKKNKKGKNQKKGKKKRPNKKNKKKRGKQN